MMDKKQQQILQNFFKEFLSWDAENVGQWIVAGFVEVTFCIYMWIPYQEIKQGDFPIFLLFWGVLGVMNYMQPYIRFNENGKVCKLYEKLKYLPISLQAIRIFRLKKLTIFCLSLFLVFLAGQILFSLVAFHEITWGNILYPLLFGFVLPFGINAITWWCYK